jgi:cell division protein FtsB
VIGRARIALLLALIAGIVITATEFPLGQLMRGRAEVARATQHLSHLQAQNGALASEVSSLHQSATVARIAHEDYGLIAKGQQSIVVLPSRPAGASSTVGSGPLSATDVPGSDLVPSDAIVSPTGTGASKGHQAVGFWGRVVQRLEFWRAIP